MPRSRTLVEDLETRGLLDSTIVIVMGEFGRTPRMNKKGVPGSDPVPGRDHWGNVMSVLVAGGGFARGRVVGSSNAKGERPRSRPVRPQDLMATLYHQLGIDPETTFLNRAGQPIKIVSNGEVISELIGKPNRTISRRAWHRYAPVSAPGADATRPAQGRG